MSAFFDMGGYAVYVWPSYFAAAVILGLLVMMSLRNLRQERQQLEKLERQLDADGKRRPRAPAAG